MKSTFIVIKIKDLELKQHDLIYFGPLLLPSQIICRNMKKKGFILILLICCLLHACKQDNSLTVKGKITGFEEGIPVYLFAPRIDGRGFFVADSVRMPANGKFTLKAPATQTELFYLIMGELDKSSPYYKYFYGAPGETNRITGEHFAPQSWRVESNIPQQKEWNRFWEAAYTPTYELEKLTVELNRIDRVLKTGTPEEITAARLESDSLRRIEARLRQEIDRATLNTILENPNTNTALEKLMNLSLEMAKEDHAAAMREDIERAYGMLTPEMKESPLGEATYEALQFPQAHPGRSMVEGELTAPDGQVKKLSDFKGKYILLHFWASWCDLCFEMFPELEALADKYKEQVFVVGVNTDDNQDTWKEAAKKRGITWNNLYTEMNSPFFRQYVSDDFPYLVLISPEGVVLEKGWAYQHGSLEKEFQKILSR